MLRLGTGRHGADRLADARDASGTAPPWFAPPGETTGPLDAALAKVNTLGGKSRGGLPFREQFHAGVAAAHANSPTDSPMSLKRRVLDKARDVHSALALSRLGKIVCCLHS